MENQSKSSNHHLKRTPVWFWTLAAVLILTGLGIRLFDITDPPMDFHPTRQLRGAIIARDLYYRSLPDGDPTKREQAAAIARSTGKYEPPILESLVAATYRVTGGEQMWVGRVYSVLFWMVGGLALLLLARCMVGSGAALVSLGYYLLLPFGAQASRSFQPDPAMTMWIVLAAWGLYSWQEDRNWKWAILSGLFGGMAVLTKAVSVYLVALAAVAVVLYAVGLRRAWRDPQVWCMAFLMVTTPGIYYLRLGQGNAGDYFANWTVALAHLLAEPSFYIRWLSFLQDLVGFSAILLALIGIMISKPANRPLLIGLWLGYLVYGMSLPYQMYTHSYYSIQLVPVIALSLAPVADLLLEKVFSQAVRWQVLFGLVALVGVFYLAWLTIAAARAEDHHSDAAYWQKIGVALPTDGRIMALTQDYGYPLMYYGWRKVTLWQTSAELNLADLRNREKDFDSSFSNKIEGMDYFLITAFNQFDNQPTLKKTLSEKYPVYAQGKGFLIYDLDHPLP